MTLLGANLSTLHRGAGHDQELPVPFLPRRFSKGDEKSVHRLRNGGDPGVWILTFWKLRIAPTVASSFNMTTGLLAVTSNAADTIKLAVDSSTQDVLVNGHTVATSSGPLLQAAVKKIQIAGGAGATRSI